MIFFALAKKCAQGGAESRDHGYLDNETTTVFAFGAGRRKGDCDAYT